MKENGSAAPEFKSGAELTHPLIRLPVHTNVPRLVSGEVTPHVTPQVAPQVGTKSGLSWDQVTGNLLHKFVVRPDRVTRAAKWRMSKPASDAKIS